MASGKYYEVFGRTSSAEPLSHLGSVEAPNDDLAQTRAWYVYDQHKWLEMCVVATRYIVPVGARTDPNIPIKAV